MLRKTRGWKHGKETSGQASMRPQRNAAENVKLSKSYALRGYPASMRPQRNAAENLSNLAQDWFPEHASMRPQRNAAENARCANRYCKGSECFNEAAA